MRNSNPPNGPRPSPPPNPPFPPRPIKAGVGIEISQYGNEVTISPTYTDMVASIIYDELIELVRDKGTLTEDDIVYHRDSKETIKKLKGNGPQIKY